MWRKALLTISGARTYCKKGFRYLYISKSSTVVSYPKRKKHSSHFLFCLTAIYIDDSTSMKREGRWESQKELIQRITQVTTLVLPEGEGVALRFINRDVDNATNLTLEGIRDILKPMTWQPGGDTPIGTNLQSKILQPLVYEKITNGALERPLLIIIITDGMPEPEDSSVLVDAILECERRLQENDYPPQSMLHTSLAVFHLTYLTLII